MYNTVTLGNGLRVISRHCASPIIYCGYQLAAGSRDEPADRQGVAHFCEHMSFKGTRRHNALQIINGLEGIGGELNAFTAKDTTVYHCAIERQWVGKAVGLLTDMVFRSTYPQTEINREAQVICDEIEAYNDSPAELIYDDFENLLFAGHPLGHNILGRQEVVRTFTTADAEAFTHSRYTTHNAVFFCYGDFDFGRLCRLLEKETADVRTGTPGSGAIVNQPAAPMEGREVRRELRTHQAHVMLGCRAYSVHDPRRMALYLINNILGGPAMNARLNLALRERNGLVYTVESSMINYSDAGLWSAYFGCEHMNVRRCLRLVRKELDRLMQRPLSERQLAAAKRQIKGQIALACDNRESFAIDFGRSFLHYGWLKDVRSLCTDIDQLTSRQLQDVAQDVFQPSRLTTLIYE